MPDSEEQQPTQEQEPQDSLDKIREDIKAMPITSQQALEGILEMMKEPKTRDLFLRMISVSRAEHIRPLNYKKSSVLPYYRKKYAEWIQKTVDAVLDTQSDKILLYSDFPDISRKTLQNRAFQAFDFLYMEMDTPDQKYLKAKQSIQIQKESRGLVFHLVTDRGLDVIAKPVQFGGDRLAKLKDDVSNFMSTGAEGTKFEKKDIQLNDDEREYFETLVLGLPQFHLKITPESLTLYKLTEAQVKLIQQG